jgi:hypothetical protein
MATPKEKYAELLLKYNELVTKHEVACDTIDKLQAELTRFTTPNK